MSYELYFTSAPRGLRPGASGFCTVAASRDMPAAVLEKVELLSGYRHLYPPLDPNNPVVYSHVPVEALGKVYQVLSRIAPAGLDYSGRGNKFAHHVILEPGELPAGGPAWLLADAGFMETQWDGTVGYLPAGRKVPAGEPAPGPCRAWERVTGDAGWAGALLQATFGKHGQAVYCLYPPGIGLLPLLAEAISLVPPEQRWQVSFHTYFTGIAPGISCLWRGIPDGTADAEKVRRQNAGAVFDISKLQGPAPTGAHVEQARTGVRQLVTTGGEPEFGRFENPVFQDLPGTETASDYMALRDEELPARVGNAIPRTPPVVPAARQLGHAPGPPAPPIPSPPRLPGSRAVTLFHWHTPSFGLGILCGCVLALTVAAGLWTMVLREPLDSRQPPVFQADLAKATVPEKTTGESEDRKLPAIENQPDRPPPASRPSSKGSGNEHGADAGKPGVDKAAGQVKAVSPQKDPGKQARLPDREQKPALQAKAPGRNLNPDPQQESPVAVSGFFSLDPRANDPTVLKASRLGASLSPNTKMELHCQKPTPNGIRFLAHVEGKDRPARSVLDITYKTSSDKAEDELAQFEIADGKLSFAWRNKVAGLDKTRKLFLEWCLLEIRNDNQDKKLFALQAPLQEGQMKALASEQGVFTLTPRKLSDWVGPELCLRAAEFVNAPEFKRSARGNPRLMESDDYVMALKQRSAGPWFIEIWPKRGAREMPILKRLVVSTTIDDYRVEVYVFDRSGQARSQ
jgi:GTPase-associated protein 1, N-terminal domain type 2/GTPase-associated protein 1, middle domain